MDQFYILNLEKQLNYLTTDYNTFYAKYYDGSANFSHSSTNKKKNKRMNYNIIHTMNEHIKFFSSFNYGENPACHKFSKTISQVLENTVKMIKSQQKLASSLSKYKCNAIKQFLNNYSVGCNYDSLIKDRRFMNHHIAKIRLRIFKFIMSSYFYSFMQGLEDNEVGTSSSISLEYQICKPSEYKQVLQEFIILQSNFSDYLHEIGAADTIKALNLDKVELQSIINNGHYKKLNKVDTALEIGALIIGAETGITPLIKLMSAVPKNTGRIKRALYKTRDVVIGELTVPLVLIGAIGTANYIDQQNLLNSEVLSFMDNDNLNKQNLEYLKKLYASYYKGQINLKKKDLENMNKANKNKCEYVNKLYSGLEDSLSNCPGCTSKLVFSNNDKTNNMKKTIDSCM